MGNVIGSFILIVNCGVGMWNMFQEQGMTQTGLQPGAASSTSTSVHSEQQVCK